MIGLLIAHVPNFTQRLMVRTYVITAAGCAASSGINLFMVSYPMVMRQTVTICSVVMTRYSFANKSYICSRLCQHANILLLRSTICVIVITMNPNHRKVEIVQFVGSFALHPYVRAKGSLAFHYVLLCCDTTMAP